MKKPERGGDYFRTKYEQDLRWRVYCVRVKGWDNYLTLMGANCAGCSNRHSKHRKEGMEISEYPEDLQEYNANSKSSLPNLKFDAMLGNIKVVNSSKVQFAFDSAVVIAQVLHLGHRGGAPPP